MHGEKDIDCQPTFGIHGQNEAERSQVALRRIQAVDELPWSRPTLGTRDMIPVQNPSSVNLPILSQNGCPHFSRKKLTIQSSPLLIPDYTRLAACSCSDGCSHVTMESLSEETWDAVIAGTSIPQALLAL